MGLRDRMRRLAADTRARVAGRSGGTAPAPAPPRPDATSTAPDLSADPDLSTGGPDLSTGGPAVAAPTRTPAEPGWRSLPPIQRALADGPVLVSDLPRFTDRLSTFQDPTLRTPLDHLVSDRAPLGVVRDLVRPRPAVAADRPSTAREAVPHLPTVQRRPADGEPSDAPEAAPAPVDTTGTGSSEGRARPRATVRSGTRPPAATPTGVLVTARPAAPTRRLTGTPVAGTPGPAPVQRSGPATGGPVGMDA
ncbi:hypothetical protein, partial [Micromonospora rosaria]